RRTGPSESRHDSMRVFAGRRVSTRGDPMLVVMRQGATQEEIAGVVRAIETRGFKAHPIPGATRTAIGITGNRGTDDRPVFESMPGLLEVIPVTHAYKLVSREVKPEDSVVSIGGVAVGGGSFVIVAGPCAVESEDQMLTVARAVKAKGARLLRGGAYKPRTSPYSFQGLGEQALQTRGRPPPPPSPSPRPMPARSRPAPATCRPSRGSSGRAARRSRCC